jgi:hypothetical protein
VKGAHLTVQKALPLLRDGAGASDELDDQHLRHSRLQRLFRNEGGRTQLRAELDSRHGGPPYPRERHQPGHDRNRRRERAFRRRRRGGAAKTYLAGLIPAGGIGQPEEIAKAVPCLASDVIALRFASATAKRLC